MTQVVKSSLDLHGKAEQNKSQNPKEKMGNITIGGEGEITSYNMEMSNQCTVFLKLIK